MNRESHMNWQKPDESLPDIDIPVIIYYFNSIFNTYAVATIKYIENKMLFTINEPFPMGTGVEIKDVYNWKYFELIH